MPIDFEAVLTTVTEMQGKVNELYDVVGTAKAAKHSTRHVGDIPFTEAEKQALVIKYQGIKTDMQTLFGQLP